ncbi:MAG: hypothetical protein Q4B71_06245 [Cardiobacteriaceae bacterium]|nr:hypothetical protein [Cardiobacteriaceae bacterium]
MNKNQNSSSIKWYHNLILFIIFTLIRIAKTIILFIILYFILKSLFFLRIIIDGSYIDEKITFESKSTLLLSEIFTKNSSDSIVCILPPYTNKISSYLLTQVSDKISIQDIHRINSWLEINLENYVPENEFYIVLFDKVSSEINLHKVIKWHIMIDNQKNHLSCSVLKYGFLVKNGKKISLMEQ